MTLSRSQGGVVVLLHYDGHALPVVIGEWEAQSIYWALTRDKQTPLGRPMTHDLCLNLLAGLGARVERLLIYKAENDTYFAQLDLVCRAADGQEAQIIRVDTRPSDGMAIVSRMENVPIVVADSVWEQYSVPVEFVSADDDLPDVEDDEDPDEEVTE